MILSRCILFPIFLARNVVLPSSRAEKVSPNERCLARAGNFNAVVEYAELFASLAGEYADLRSIPEHPSLNSDPTTSYKAGIALASATLVRGLNGIIYPSIRHKGGTCFAVLWSHAVQSVAQGGMFRLTWSGSSTPRIEQVSR
jgi:hypothetical protein